VITTTFNSLESLRENTQRFDYVFLGSVFNSHSYYSRDEEAGMNMLKSIVKKSPSVVYALGGVTPERIPMVEEAGFGGVGLSSAVWKNFDKNPEKVLSVIKAA
ncbi:MAG: thiamine phosphate synthase, partial [Salibacteraceae bacterium]